MSDVSAATKAALLGRLPGPVALMTAFYEEPLLAWAELVRQVQEAREDGEVMVARDLVTFCGFLLEALERRGAPREQVLRHYGYVAAAHGKAES